MNPIHTTQADFKSPVPLYEATEDCRICEGRLDLNCRFCSNKGKTTKLIFKIEDFKECICKTSDLLCFNSNWEEKENGRLFHKPCKGTGYILPNKGYIREIRKFEGKDGCECDCHNNFKIMHCKDCIVKKFHLTKDAEVKKVGETKYFSPREQSIHNLALESKIVICGGYYE